MKHLWYAAIAVTMALLLAGCGGEKILHCDKCGTEVTVSESSNMTDDWTIYCNTCEEELFGDNPVVEDGDLPDVFKEQ